MNFYPYYASIPYMTAPARTGLFRSLLGGIKWSSIVDGTQKVLGIANQAIPLIRQARPMFHNAKTMFKIMNEFKRFDSPSETKVENHVENNHSVESSTTNSHVTQDNGLTFFQ